MTEFAVTAIGADRPGIIARVTAVLFERGGNLRDSSMTILGGHFAITLLVSADVAAAELEAALVAATADLGLIVAVREVVPAGVTGARPTHGLAVRTRDRPGIVHAVATCLAEAGVNVTNLETRTLPGTPAVYAMMLEVTAPAEMDHDGLAELVRRHVTDAEVSAHPIAGATG